MISMESSLDLATVVGGYTVAISMIAIGWASYHWKALQQRQLTVASVFELILLVAFASVVAAWLIQTPWTG
jgi:hypothetical protein